jgi:SPP1 gp7 family putative phage head morphogenesis protein
MDEADRLTEEALAHVEARIARIYGQAVEEITEKAAAHYRDLERKDIAMRARLERGEITEQDYRDWLSGQMLVGQINEDMRDQLAAQLTSTNELAAAFVNDSRLDVFAVNHNYSAYGLETTYGNLSFTLYNAEAVRRIIVDNPDLLPDPVSIDIPLDKRWNREKIGDVIASSILQGKSVPKIARDLEIVVGMNKSSAVRNARSAITGAQNAGRQASFAHAAEMGIDVRKRWVATKDSRTRDSHRDLDGTTVPWNEPFHTILGSVIMHPGDRNAKPGDFYNCRCTMRTVEKPGIEAEPRMMRVRDPKTGKNVVVSEMTYRQWERWVKSRA